MGDYSNEPLSWASRVSRYPPPPHERSSSSSSPSPWKIVLGFVFLHVVGIAFLVFFWWVQVQTLEGGWICPMGTSKFNSFDTWGGSMAVQKDGGNCTSEFKCSAEFAFLKGSVLMTRGCLNPEEMDAVEKDPEGLLWIMTNQGKEEKVSCFIRKTDDTTLTCAYDSFRKTMFPKMGGRIPKRYFERYRKTLCSSPKVKRGWWNMFIPFRASSLLSCTPKVEVDEEGSTSGKKKVQ